MRYEAVIGLEVHAQLLTESKMFCGCSTRFGARPNSQTCEVCTGMPGALPVPNQRAVEFALRLGLAMGCRLQSRTYFARKNYFYADLPKGYQISQSDVPVCLGGGLQIETEEGPRQIRLIRIHLEEDAGKNLHDQDPKASLLDLNRCGTPLVEIVSQPDLRSAREAYVYLNKLKQLVQYLEICDGNMEEGSLRCDANVSLRLFGAELGTRNEIKNLNSFRAVEQAIEFEIQRQSQVLSEGGTVQQETRLWDADRGETRTMRSKEDSQDYRYFNEPDIGPVVIAEDWLENVARQLPELPDDKRQRFVSSYGLSAYDAATLTQTRQLADYYEQAVAEASDAKKVANWVSTELLGALNERGLELAASPVAPGSLGRLVALIEDGTLSGKMAKEVFAKMLATSREAADLVQEMGLQQIRDRATLEPIVRKILEDHPEAVANYRAGKEGVMGFFVGQVMRATHGQAGPAEVNALLRRLLQDPHEASE